MCFSFAKYLDRNGVNVYNRSIEIGAYNMKKFDYKENDILGVVCKLPVFSIKK